MHNHNTFETKLFHPEDLPKDVYQILNSSPDHFCIKDQQIYLLLNGIIICCPDNDSGQKMISSIMQQSFRSFSKPDKKEEVFKSILYDPFFHPAEDLLKQFRIAPDLQRCAIVFRSFSPLNSGMIPVFESIVPIVKDDTVIPESCSTIILIKSMKNITVSELIEYSEAVVGSMETEGVSGIKAGIGRVVSDPDGIRISYLEACRALSLGKKYHPHDHVFVFQRQTLEKIIDCIPPEERKALRQQFFISEPSVKLSGELLETVRVFFQNDLNLTAASRQLFIHRNTLNYRLDKIKKDFGLDLRSFQDAVVFKILSEIPEES